LQISLSQSSNLDSHFLLAPFDFDLLPVAIRFQEHFLRRHTVVDSAARLGRNPPRISAPKN
jgi:hypothetical protein